VPSNEVSKIISEISNSRSMARSKTGSFWLTETVQLPATAVSGDRASGSIDLGAYVDVGDKQALAIEQCDIIVQVGENFGGDTASMITAAGAITTQLTDLNPGGIFVRADDNSLIASGSLNIGGVALGISSNSSDFFPDNFGKLDESRMVVNDSLFVVTGVDQGDIAASNVYVTVRAKCRIVSLNVKDWMAIAISGLASDS